MDNWKVQTVDTILRIRSIYQLIPDLDDKACASLWVQARLQTEAMRVPEAKFWGVFVNTLRILVAVRMKRLPDPEDLFDTPRATVAHGDVLTPARRARLSVRTAWPDKRRLRKATPPSFEEE